MGAGGMGYNCAGGQAAYFIAPVANSGGGSGSGGMSSGNFAYRGSPGGGGVGIMGKGADGVAFYSCINYNYVGGGGSGGANAANVPGRVNCSSAHAGGDYGGGGGMTYYCYCSGTSGYGGYGGGGAVRIVWPGTTRQFPSTSVGSP
jgi:hypothetical protein